jgi:two-component system, NtrC family, response regulator AlgB
MSSVPDPPVSGRILAIDDDRQLLESFAMFLTERGHRVTTADNLADGLRHAATQPFHVCLLDRTIGYDSGLAALPRLRELAPQMRVIMVTGHAGVDEAVKAMAQGASDYLVKPCSAAQLQVAVARQLDTRRLLDRIETLERDTPAALDQLESDNPRMRDTLRLAMQVAGTDANVLLLGESGTGKGVLAAAIHQSSPRAGAPLATIHCPSLSAELLESELFGHAKGAFTGATQSTVGRVSHADGGSLFLDEVGDFPLSLQPKLLRFIQDKEFERLGDPATRRADVRIIAATNRDLQSMVAQGQFRLDLYYRLNVIALTLPSLRDRAEDIENLALRFVAQFARRYGRPATGFTAAARAAMRAYRWPGNIRELQNVIERAVILCDGAQIEATQLALGPVAAPEPAAGPHPGSPVSLAELERVHIQRVLESAPTLEAAARILGIDSSTLYRKRRAMRGQAPA